jgi:undecaprenyl-diphosphatase
VVEHRLGVLDPFMVAFSLIGSFGAVFIAIAAVLAVMRRLPSAFMLVTAGVLLADMLALLLKVAGGRKRPFLVDPEQDPLVGTPLDLSLPSGHAATSFAGATLLAWYAPRLALPLFALAVLVAWSRVYVGVHYPLDILAGAVLGFVVARALRWLEANRPRSPQAQPRG